jgi:hypothetical protein
MLLYLKEWQFWMEEAVIHTLTTDNDAERTLEGEETVFTVVRPNGALTRAKETKAVNDLFNVGDSNLDDHAAQTGDVSMAKTQLQLRFSSNSLQHPFFFHLPIRSPIGSFQPSDDEILFHCPCSTFLLLKLRMLGRVFVGGARNLELLAESRTECSP